MQYVCASFPVKLYVGRINKPFLATLTNQELDLAACLTNTRGDVLRKPRCEDTWTMVTII